jgi:hypothetical protein
MIWFWLYFTTLFTLFGFIFWVISFFYPQFYRTNIIRYLSSMKRINIHHFPQNPFQEQIHHRRHSHHSGHHHHHRPYSFGHHSNYSAMNSAHRHHSILSPFSGRTLNTSVESTRLTHAHEQLTISISPEREHIETNVTSTSEEQSPSPPTSQRITAARSESISIPNEDNLNVASFLTDYLGHDGTLVLYILKINTNEVITGEIVTALFELFKTNYRTDRTE